MKLVLDIQLDIRAQNISAGNTMKLLMIVDKYGV